jgi:hypothetical protein
MINDLDESLRQLLIEEALLSPAEVDISFDIPTREWSTPVTRPTVNLYLYDMRENRQLRETYWDTEAAEEGRVRLSRRPVRIDLSYMITCWTSTPEDQHRLLWRVLETLFRNSPLPEQVLHGALLQSDHPVRTDVAQPDGVLKNLSDFWGALENQLRPAINLVVTVDLDLAQQPVVPLVFSRILKVGSAGVARDLDGHERLRPELAPGWESAPLTVGGTVRDAKGQPVPDAQVRVVAAERGQPPRQVGSSVATSAAGRYILYGLPPATYTLIVESPGHPVWQKDLVVAVGERGALLPEFIWDVEVGMA